MKKIFLILALGISILACKTNDKKVGTDAASTNENAVTNTEPEELTTIEWIDPVTQKLGNLTKGKEIEITFRFKNSGDKMLVIENVTASCGCTIPEKPEKPFAPGEEGVIRAKFNGSGQGTISKTVTVTANTTPQKTYNLIFTGEIVE
ncbi:MAG TPA: DUF1573 domain-containing protein [Chitinophagaceae bacterium]|nr:DUF1573 domain-containing protein [Chitinophagaceae bacterium]MCB9055774.1 DUF1573 domain-containing protein [Chitinophagales bacterium]HPG11767.1 DUF1573 domain-containing protein [Chitinophagaceae bacterium]HRX94608.1 DUF1573 domain-containing protein [Chitinophagaceae bacterium]